MSLRRAMDQVLRRAFGAATDDYFDIFFGTRPPHHTFSTQSDLDVYVWYDHGAVLRPDVDAAALEACVDAIKRQVLGHLFPAGAELLALFVDSRRPEPPPVPHEMENVSCHDWLGPLSESVFTFARLCAGAPALDAWLAARHFCGYYLHPTRAILVALAPSNLYVYSTEPAVLTAIEQLLAPAVAAARSRFAPP